MSKASWKSLGFGGGILCVGLLGPVIVQAEEPLAMAQAPGAAEATLSLEEILNLKSSLATKRTLSSRETPSVISIITREDILDSGVKSLQDALSLLVPGFNFGSDVEGQINVGYRGFWAGDGKLLMMVDGLDVNDELFGDTFFLGHIPVEIIERIEMVRGPGSPLYGGYAGVAVLNVITRAEALDGVYASGHYAQMAGGYLSRAGTLAVGKSAEDYQFSGLISFNQAQYTDQPGTDINGDAVTLKNQQVETPTLVNVRARYKELELKILADLIPTTQVVMDGPGVAASPENESFTTYVAQLKWAHKFWDGLTVTPKIAYKISIPWHIDYNNDSNPANDWAVLKTASRWTPNIEANWDVGANFNLLAGFEDSFMTIARDTSEPLL